MIRGVASSRRAGQFVMLSSNSLRMCWENQALDPLVGTVVSSSTQDAGWTVARSRRREASLSGFTGVIETLEPRQLDGPIQLGKFVMEGRRAVLKDFVSRLLMADRSLCLLPQSARRDGE
jgi:hypothetical protein